ncbi:hypothetical protein [Microscilla marina]|uniref:Uncharacterized protein n=1 Tax=Microscilla marina ATCC 23134 TaxID=313606 RepID=A1ZCZ3_MICM2|nr:hypothetical protein [Microscilla marina]EAY31532.1 hypothetical protein M23134_05038 [Microscilla marina ATCC 23134]
MEIQNDRIIIRGESYEGQEDPLEIVGELLESLGATLVDQTGFFVRDKPRYEKWIISNSNILLVFDSLIEGSYIVVNSDVSQDVVQAIKKNVNYVSLEGELQYHQVMLGDLANEKNLAKRLPFNQDHLTFIQRLALIFKSYDKNVFNIFQNALSHPSEGMRITTLCAFHYIWWLELKPLIRRVVREDNNEIIRRFASDIISYYEKPEPGVFMEKEIVPHWWSKCVNYKLELLNSRNNNESSIEDLDLPPFLNL